MTKRAESGILIRKQKEIRDHTAEPYGGKTVRTGKRSICRLCALALLPVLLLSCCFSARAEEQFPSFMPDATVIIAEAAVTTLGITDAEGNPLTVRKAPEMNGRGKPEVKGQEPDYRGVLGYMALQSEWEVSRFNTFVRTPWVLPVYDGPDGDRVAGEIQHKTPVLVIDQQIKERLKYRFAGRLQVIRLDTSEIVWVDVTQFVTVPYWTLDVTEAVKYGFSIVVYRSKSRHEPMDRKKHTGPLPDGSWVLLCEAAKFPYHISPDKENRPLLGIIFRSNREDSEAYRRYFLFFNAEDLTLVY